jgi:putative tryptophan/tyrosine transport system substrate-binding protein
MEEKSARAKSDLVQNASSPGSQPVVSETQKSPLPNKKNKPFFGIVVGIVAALLIVGIVGWYFWVNNVKTQKVYRVGILSGLNYFADITTGFKGRMAELGYTDGKNVTYDLHQTDFDMVAYKNILNKFITDKSDLILVFPTEAAQLAKSMTSETKIPMIFVGADVENIDLIKSVREPGGNVTGVRWTGAEVALAHYKIMRELAPQIKRYLIPFQRGIAIVGPELTAIHTAADKDTIKIVEIPADNAAELAGKLKSTMAESTDAVLLIDEPLAPSPEGSKILNDFASTHKILIGGILSSANKEYNSLFEINPSNVEMGKQAAALAVKILQGFPVGKIPVSSAELRLTINYRAIQKMKLNIGDSILSRANEIIR